MIIDERIFSSLSDEQKKAVEAAQSPEELLAIAKKTGYKMSEEQLDAIAAHSWCEDYCADYFGRQPDPDDHRPRFGVCNPLCYTHS